MHFDLNGFTKKAAFFAFSKIRMTPVYCKDEYSVSLCLALKLNSV